MARIRFDGEQLADLGPMEPDQQVKLYFPKPGQDRPRLPDPDTDDFARWYDAFNAIPETDRPWTRSYTLRAHDPERRTIDIDFVLHHDPSTSNPDAVGPATRWAHRAEPGDTIGMFGPSASFARPVSLRTSIAAADWLLLVGDETALPAIAGVLESLPAGTRAIAYLEIADAAEEQHFDSKSDVMVHWLHRSGDRAGTGDRLVSAVRNATLPAGSMFAWLAGEATAVRALRRHLVDERGVDKRSIDFTGHWRLRLSEDDAPTAEDLADASERLEEFTEASTSAPFDETYESRTAPWVIGEPQPAVVELERAGWIRGTVLDVGCGTGEHTIHLARLGYDVVGMDSSEPAIVQANLNALRHGVPTRFEVADAMCLDDRTYDTILDSGLFHNIEAEHRPRYVRGLHQACRPGGLVHVLALSDAGPGYGPEVSETELRTTFGAGWVLEELRASQFRGVVGADGELGDLPAWLARIRRS